MKKIDWVPAIELGIEEIDNQHKNLVNIINMLDFAINNKKQKLELIRIIEALVRYSRYHFDTEECLFKEHGYVDEEHIKEHEEYIFTVDEFYSEEITEELAREIHDFLVNWFYHHILHTDKKFADYLKK